MTFTLGLTSAKSVFLVVDHRISWSNRFEDRGVKVATVKAVDGLALLGYAGLGETAKGTQPSTWMRNLLDGRMMTVEGCLAELAIGIEQEFPPHLVDIGDHLVVISAVVDNQPRMYGIHLRERNVGYVRLRQGRLADSGTSEEIAPRAIYTGSGGAWFAMRNSKANWLREVYSRAREHDAGRISSAAVADVLARLDAHVAGEVADVSPSCTVAWATQDESGIWQFGKQFYDDAVRTAGSSFADPIQIEADGNGDHSRPLEFPGIEMDAEGIPPSNDSCLE
jgi:hypothetical protein